MPERAAATVIRVATYALGLMHLRPASSLSLNDLYQPIRRLLLYLLGGEPTSCEENLGERYCVRDNDVYVCIVINVSFKLPNKCM